MAQKTPRRVEFRQLGELIAGLIGARATVSASPTFALVFSRMLSPESPTIGPDDPVSFGGLSQRNQVLSAIADQVAPPHLFKRFPQQWPVVRVVIAQKSLMEASLVETP